MMTRRTALAVSIVALLACSSKKQHDPDSAPDPKQAAAAQAAREWKQCAELWLAIAATANGEARVTALYEAASCQAMNGEIDSAFATLDRALVAGLHDMDVSDDYDLDPLKYDPRWEPFVEKLRAAAAVAETRISNPALRDELVALEAQHTILRGPTLGLDDESKRLAAELDRKTVTTLKAIIAKHGWPRYSTVGRAGETAVWWLVLGSEDLAFQKDCLAMLERAVAQGEGNPTLYAYLYDRVAVRSGKPQRWGTQIRDGKPYPIEDEAHVDDRRRALGLPTMANELKQYSAPDKSR
jgi:hypothetical protein